MIYLTFDSNIWIYSLDESWKIENQLDFLEPWIQNGDVKILLPKIIIDEWGKHEEEQVKERKKKLKDFFEMAEEILPSAFYSEYKEPSTQRLIIDSQLARAKSIILSSEIIPDYPEVTQRVINDGIAKRAPLHKKSSVADAVIVFSLIQYAKLNPGNYYFFISANTEDFYQKSEGKKEIHAHLKPDFDTYNICPFTTLNELMNFLQTARGLKVDENIHQRRRERIKNKIKEKIYNPEYETLTESGEPSHIQNLNTIDFILNERKPTKEQVIFVLALMDSDPTYQPHFYGKLSNPNWFKILKKRGIFNPANNPAPILVENGYSIPRWEPLFYLEKISQQIKDGQAIELTNDIIKIINNVSTLDSDNYITWHFIIRILINLPNDKVPLDTLSFIPTWLNGKKFDPSLQGMAICESLLPKFLSTNLTPENITKAELIVKHVLSIEEVEDRGQSGFFGLPSDMYRSIIGTHYLLDSLIDKGLASQIAAKCSETIISDLADNLKKLRFSFPNGINISIKTQDDNYNIKAKIENDSVNFSISSRNSTEHIPPVEILNFESFSDHQTKALFIQKLKEAGIDYQENEENTQNANMLLHALFNGIYYSVSNDSISKLNEDYDREKLVEAFSLIFRDVLNAKVKDNPQRGITLLRLFATDNKYRLPFFRRVVLFIIGENWKETKCLFWELLSDKDPLKLFSDLNFEKELYELLDKNQNLLISNEINSLQKILALGSQDKEDNDTEYWQLRWYSALRNISPFKENYERLSKSRNLTNEHYEELGEVKIRAGAVSPFTVEEILQKSIEDIANFLKDFKPKDRWEEPNINGLCSALSKAIKNSPQTFADKIDLFIDIPYIYAYHLANGFKP